MRREWGQQVTWRFKAAMGREVEAGITVEDHQGRSQMAGDPRGAGHPRGAELRGKVPGARLF